LTGESVPAAKDAETLSDGDLGAGDQENMAFMHTPVTHGSGVMIVTSVGGQTEVGKIAGMLSATAVEETPLTKQMNTLTLWIVGAAGITMIIMFALGLYRGQSWTMLFTTAVALAIAAIPLALPMVVQVVLSLGSVELAQAESHRQGPAVRRDAGLYVGDQLGQNRNPDDEPDDRRRGARSD
jgi:Ca2+-transporting ATPase